MNTERVKFYGRNDFSYSYMLQKAIDKVREFDNNKTDYSLDDILELYNTVKFIDDDAQSLLKNEDDKKVFNKSTKGLLMKPISIFFNNLNDFAISDIVIDSSHIYAEDFLNLFDKYNCFRNIKAETFILALKRFRIPFGYIFYNKKIVHAYDGDLVSLMLNEELAFDLLLKKYFSTDKKQGSLYLPASLSKKDKEKITLNYINSDQAHVNVLDIIISMPCSKEFSISDDTRVLAKDKHDKLVAELFAEKKDGALAFSAQVKFTKTLKQEFTITHQGTDLELTVNDQWIRDNLDYPTLLNNLIYIFNLTDMEMRFKYTSKPNSMSLIERAFWDKKLKTFYLCDTNFKFFNSFMQIEVAAYKEFLESTFNIRLEEVVQWFFDSYLSEEFSLFDFSINMPSKGSTYLEKCRTICSELESLLKQYDSLIKYGRIRHDVIEISSHPAVVENVRSYIKEKYIYPQKNQCGAVMHFLFSDQYLLTYFENHKEREQYSNFYEMLCKEKVNIAEYKDYQISELQYLINKKVIALDKEGYFYFINKKQVFLLYDLYVNEFASYNFYVKLSMQETIRKLEKQNWITIGSSLLSIPESSYINFYLNKRKYFNGYDLRNKYLHGTQHKKGRDDELHKSNYITLLSLFLMLVIKINDDLCQHEEHKKLEEHKSSLE